MTAPVVARQGGIFPGFTLPDADGAAVSLERHRGRRNLAVVFAADLIDERPVTALLHELLARTEALTVEAAQVLVVVTAPRIAGQRVASGFPTLVDDGGRIHRAVGATDTAGRPAPAVFVTDRFREIFAAYVPGRDPGVPSAQEILEWLVFINIQCPECGVPEWPPD